MSDWCMKWELPLQMSKCSIMTYTLKKNINDYPYMLSDSFCLSRANEVKDLGVFMTSKLNFSIHVQRTIQTAFKMLGFLKRESENLKEPFTVMLLYKALIRSHLEYASSIWNSHKKCIVDSLERVQRKFLKFFASNFA